MQNPMLSQLPQIRDMFAPNPHIAPNSLDVVFELKTRQEETFLAIDVHQFIFIRATIEIPNDGEGYRFIVAGQDTVTGYDLASLYYILLNDGFVKGKAEQMSQLFKRAKVVKNKYPRKGRAKKRA